MLCCYEQTYPLSADDRPATASVVRDLAGHWRCRPCLPYRPRRSSHLLHLETALSQGWLWRSGSLSQSCSQTHTSYTRTDRCAGHRPSPVASRLGQTTPGRPACQIQQLGAARLSQHRQTHPTRRRPLEQFGGDGKKGGLTPCVRTAEQPGQTLNVDLCLVPATHILEQKLPAVSCSSGRLVAERPTPAQAEPSYPGQVFADPDCPYEQAMQAFVTASTAPAAASSDTQAPSQAQTRRAAKRVLRQQGQALRQARRAVRERRKQQDAAWRSLRSQRQSERTVRQPPKPPAAAARRRQAQQQEWRELRAQRRTQLEQREREDAQWRAEREQLRAQFGQLPLVSAWLAILVITDNCTRQCLGVPLFSAGAKVTAEMVVAALRTLLPAELQFLITDRGVHFTAQVFAQLAQEEQFIHVLIARHRPESNGIAERFVRTLKEWLADKAWESAQELDHLLGQFRAEYNQRPHQGIAIPGLSPTEFAERIWLF